MDGHITSFLNKRSSSTTRIVLVRELCAHLLKQVVGIDVPVTKMHIEGTVLHIQTTPLFKHEIQIKNKALLRALSSVSDTAHITRI